MLFILTRIVATCPITLFIILDDHKPHLPIKSMFDSSASQLRVAIDLDYEHLMGEKVLQVGVALCMYSARLQLTFRLQLTMVHIAT